MSTTGVVVQLSVESNKTISVTEGDTILFPLKVEPKSVLTVERWVGDTLKTVDKFIITDSTFNYKMVPSPGNNKVVFKLTDRFGNITTTDVYITREKGVNNQPLIRPEYSHIIANKQIAALSAMLKIRADDKLRKFI